MPPMIVTARPPKRTKAPRKPVALAQRFVVARKLGKNRFGAPQSEEPDEEADGRVKAFFERVIKSCS